MERGFIQNLLCRELHIRHGTFFLSLLTTIIRNITRNVATTEERHRRRGGKAAEQVTSQWAERRRHNCRNVANLGSREMEACPVQWRSEGGRGASEFPSLVKTSPPPPPTVFKIHPPMPLPPAGDKRGEPSFRSAWPSHWRNPCYATGSVRRP